MEQCNDDDPKITLPLEYAIKIQEALKPLNLLLTGFREGVDPYCSFELRISRHWFSEKKPKDKYNTGDLSTT